MERGGLVEPVAVIEVELAVGMEGPAEVLQWSISGGIDNEISFFHTVGDLRAGSGFGVVERAELEFVDAVPLVEVVAKEPDTCVAGLLVFEFDFIKEYYLLIVVLLRKRVIFDHLSSL